MTAHSIADAAYIVAALLFIMSLAGLSRHESSRPGIYYGIAGMAIALAATIGVAAKGDEASALPPLDAVTGSLMAVALLIGAAIGLWRGENVAGSGPPGLTPPFRSLFRLPPPPPGWGGCLFVGGQNHPPRGAGG